MKSKEEIAKGLKEFREHTMLRRDQGRKVVSHGWDGRLTAEDKIFLKQIGIVWEVEDIEISTKLA